MIVTSPDNYERTRKLRFTIQGIKSRHRRKAERMTPGDRICWYLTGLRSFAATGTITSPYFEGMEPVWVSEKTGDTYPWRFKITKDHALDPNGAVPAASLLDTLAFVKRWPAQHRSLAFQGNIHELADADFASIERAIERAERKGEAA